MKSTTDTRGETISTEDPEYHRDYLGHKMEKKGQYFPEYGQQTVWITCECGSIWALPYKVSLNNIL